LAPSEAWGGAEGIVKGGKVPRPRINCLIGDRISYRYFHRGGNWDGRRELAGRGRLDCRRINQRSNGRGTMLRMKMVGRTSTAHSRKENVSFQVENREIWECGK